MRRIQSFNTCIKTMLHPQQQSNLRLVRDMAFLAITASLVLLSLLMIVPSSQDDGHTLTHRRLLRKGASAMGGSSAFRNIDNVLFFSSPVSPAPFASELHPANGYLLAPQSNPSISTFSMDVGVNVGKVMYEKWLKQLPHTFVIGIEANKELVDGLLQRQDYKQFAPRALLIQAAASSKRGVARFNPGVGYPKPDQISDQVYYPHPSFLPLPYLANPYSLSYIMLLSSGFFSFFF